MQTDMLKSVLLCGIQATSKMTDCMIEFLSEETGQKVKSAGASLLKQVHEITGDMLGGEQQGEKADKPIQAEITIE